MTQDKVRCHFPKKKRLAGPNGFSALFKSGDRVHGTWFMLLCRPNTLSFDRLGISLPKKNIRHAHDRHRIKRLIREFFRTQSSQSLGLDYVISGKKGLSTLHNAEILEHLATLWRRRTHNATPLSHSFSRKSRHVLSANNAATTKNSPIFINTRILSAPLLRT